MAVILQDYISEEIHQLKTEANAAFQAKNYDAALSMYLDILAQLPPRRPETDTVDDDNDGGNDGDESGMSQVAKDKRKADDPAEETEEEEQIRNLRSIIYANVAATHLRLLQYKQAVQACNQSLIDQPTYIKALYRRAQANEEIGGWAGLSSAIQDYQSLLKDKDLPSATRPSITAALHRLQPQADQAAQKEKDEMLDKLKGLGDSLLGNFGLSTKNFQFTQQEGGGYSMNFVR